MKYKVHYTSESLHVCLVEASNEDEAAQKHDRNECLQHDVKGSYEYDDRLEYVELAEEEP